MIPRFHSFIFLNLSSIVIRHLLILSISLCASVSGAFASEILMRFRAQEDYVRPTGLDGKPSVETYAFYIGEYHPAAHETEEEAISFDTIARILIEELSKQNYVLSEVPKDADYILMIHWGQTNPESSTEEVTHLTYNIDEEEDDEFTVEEIPEHINRKNASLLGASKIYNSMSRISLKKRLVEEAIVQDRYFINIFAASISDLKKWDTKDEQIKATWECQLSVPVDDRDGAVAMRSMAETGSGYFGQNVQDLTFMKEGIKKGVVTIGEIQFLETTEDSESNETGSEDTESE